METQQCSILYLQEAAQAGIVVKILHVKALNSMQVGKPWGGNCIAVDVPSAACSVDFYSIRQPASILERPQARQSLC